MAVAVAAGDGDGDGELGREGGSSEIRAGAGGVSDGYRRSLSLYNRWWVTDRSISHLLPVLPAESPRVDFASYVFP